MMTEAVLDSTAELLEATAQRQEWMALLARAPLSVLEEVLGKSTEATQWLRPPETGLVMAQARIGGSGERFNLGEVTVTRCALRLKHDATSVSAVGLAYIVGRSHRHAHLAAVADALLQDPCRRLQLEDNLLAPVRHILALDRAGRQARARATRVEFFTVAREVGTGESDER